MRLRAVAVLAVVVATLAMTAAPASADAFTFLVTGNLTTSGTWAPASPNCGSIPCPAANTWGLTASGTGDHGTFFGTVTISGSGTFNGWCGSSQGQGTVSVSGIGTGTVSWNEAGGTGTMSGTVGGHSFNMTLQMRAVAPGGDCVTSAGTTFLFAAKAWGA